MLSSEMCAVLMGDYFTFQFLVLEGVLRGWYGMDFSDCFRLLYVPQVFGNKQSKNKD